MNEQKAVFSVLSAIDVSEHIETKKNGQTELSYLSWAWAWHICKQNFPQAFYTIYENQNGRPYFDAGRTAWVKTGVTIEGLEHIEYLPIMDYRNASIPVDRITSFDMNKSIQRSLTKAVARHGLGLYVYAGEDLPWSEEEAKAHEEAAAQQPQGTQARRNRTVKTKPAPAQEQAPAPAPKHFDLNTLDPAKYNAWVACAAEGKKTKTGLPGRDGFINTFAPTEAQLADFDTAVFNYRMEHGIQATANA